MQKSSDDTDVVEQVQKTQEAIKWVSMVNELRPDLVLVFLWWKSNNFGIDFN